MNARRVGRFYVAGRFFDDPTPNLFNEMVIVDVVHEFWLDRRKYTAFHPDFVLIEEGSRVPLYKAEFSATSIYPRWVRSPSD